ncbi:hypothetical protein [Pedobacter psychrodurus]|uniref:hypothetical protein n=1 Tax=Pedobacter psychrodurus TaxID=2530456 RepID=UPI00292EF0BB|nr:hypothetical protein [Pedobacter psychrodurus]
MKLILITLLTGTFYFSAHGQTAGKEHKSYRREKSVVDSSFIKLVSGLNQLIKDRVKADFPKFSSVAYSDYVMIDQTEKVSMDSLYKYKLKDFKSITVSFGESPALYGGKSDYGVIILKRKD